MSLLLNQPSKLCFRKPVLVRSSPLLSNGLSSFYPQNYPYVIISPDPCGGDRGKVWVVSSRSISAPRITVEESLERHDTHTKLIKELRKDLGTIGSSNGWLPTLKDGVLGLRDMKIDPKRISLPPLETLSHCQTHCVTNVAMSSSPEEEDCVVAVKFLGPQLSLCRPAQSNSKWTNIRIENPCFFSSAVMFSKKDDMFCIAGSGGHLMGSWDLHGHSKKNPKLQSLRFQNLPKLTKRQRDLLDSCWTSEYLAESRATGETFLVKWYKKTTGKIIKGIARMETEAVMVFKIDKEGNAVYTQDIGDQSIVLMNSEALCDPFLSYFCHHNRVAVFDVDENIRFKLPYQKWNRSRRPSPTLEYSMCWFWLPG